MILMKSDYTYIAGTTGRDRDVDLEVMDLAAGTYYVFAELEWDDWAPEKA